MISSKVFPRLMVVLAFLFTACATAPTSPSTPPTRTPLPTPSTTITRTPTSTATVSPTTTRPAGPRAVWENFAAPQLPQITPIPPPLTGLKIPEEVRVLVIAGVDRGQPYTGRTDALALVIYHPRLARASLVSIPPDLIGYIPGYTMQRMNTAYAVGGARRLSNTLEYNFGLRPTSYAILNLDDFQNFVDDLGGINVTILENMRPYCPGIPPGVVLLNGTKALCYMRLRLGEDEQARNRRQQEVLRTVFLRLVEGGNLARVSELYQRHRDVVDTNLTLDDILQSVPLALKLGDPARIGYFQLSEKELSLWQISQHPKTDVFLPNRPAVMVLMQKAIDFVSTPSPLKDVVITLEYQLTISPTPTSTYTATPTATNTFTPRPTYTPTQTITPTWVITNTRTVTPTRTITPTQTVTPSRTP